MTVDRGGIQSTQAFSAWSPVVAVVGALVAESSPGWVTAAVWGLAVLCALPATRFRLVVPYALLIWTAGWLVAVAVRFAAAGLVGLFVVK